MAKKKNIPVSKMPSTVRSCYDLDLTLIPAWISNYIHYNVWDEITSPFPNFNGCTVEVWEWISNLIPHITRHVIIYPCWDSIYDTAYSSNGQSGPYMGLKTLKILDAPCCSLMGKTWGVYQNMGCLTIMSILGENQPHCNCTTQCWPSWLKNHLLMRNVNK